MKNEEFLSTRNVAEYAYCPRLFYLMEVEGVFLPSSDTEKGKAVHKKVDKPSSSSVLEKGEDADSQEDDLKRPVAVRSLTLSSENLGITATLDLAEINGNKAVPVEYRKGRPRKKVLVPPPEDTEDSETLPLCNNEPWKTDAVQVALQSLLLEEAGYKVEKGILYYASEKLRLGIIINDSLKTEALKVLESAKQCYSLPRPLPLVNDSRCPKCSLQPICLPDEVNFQRACDITEEITPRKIWPPRDDGIHIVAQLYGGKVGVRGDALRVTDKDGKTVKEAPLVCIESLSILGAVQISTQAIHTLSDRGIPISFLSAAGRLISMIDPMDSVSAKVRRAQVIKLEQNGACLEISRSLINSKIINQRTLLMRNNSTLPLEIPEHLLSLAKKAKNAESLESLRGYEGQAANLYFRYFYGVFSGNVAEEFKSNGRKRRPSPDPINSCLSMGYTMLCHECVAALRTAGLEPSIGAFHISRPGRPAFALDLMEPFRPIIADSVAVTAFNRQELTDGHFQRTAAGCILTNYGRKAFFNVYGRRMNTEITHPIFEYRLSYRRMLILHARMISAWLLGEINSLSFLTTR